MGRLCYLGLAMNAQAKVVKLPASREPQPELERLEQALADIRADARKSPKTYQRDTVVPEGGE